MIFVRSLHEATARPLTGSEGFSCCLTFSPNGRSIAFVADNRVLKRVPVEGGAATTITEGNFRFLQHAWADNGTILLAQYDPNQPGVIYRVPDTGGRPIGDAAASPSTPARPCGRRGRWRADACCCSRWSPGAGRNSRRRRSTPASGASSHGTRASD